MKKQFLCLFIGEGMDHKVYHSVLVTADTKEEALEKYFASGKAYAYDADSNKEYYDAIEFTEKNTVA